MFLFPIALTKRMLERILRNPDAVSDLSFFPEPLNSIFRKILSLEAVLIPRYSLPFGLSVIAIARKPY
jgi:hypothetical protein